MATSLFLSPSPVLPRLSTFPKPATSAALRRHQHRHRHRRARAASTTAAPSQQASEPESSPSSSSSSSQEKFSWRDHWYPVSLVADLDPRRPTAFQLLNRDLVLWRDPASGDWTAFDDRCPHRLAPLSEGRIDEDGRLQCSYHGWSFDTTGACTRIPQAAADGPEARAVGSPRACVTRFPTMVSQGLLFVWPDENGWEKAAISKPPMLPDDFNDPSFSSVTIQRDLYYGYDTLMENVSDPSHIDFAHHKVTGRRDRAKPLPFKVESSGLWGFSGSNSGNPRISAEFIAPCYYINKIEIDTALPLFGAQKWVIWICSFNIPMAPGKTRSIVCSARNFFQLTMPGPSWWQLVPRWHEHWTSNKVYDGDMIVLQGQEKVFLSKSMEASGDVNQQYTKITFTPTGDVNRVMSISSIDWFWHLEIGCGDMATANRIGLAPPTNTLCPQQFYPNARCWIDMNNIHSNARHAKVLMMPSRLCKRFLSVRPSSSVRALESLQTSSYDLSWLLWNIHSLSSINLLPVVEYTQLVPRWHEHWTSNKVYDGDMIVLQGQEKVFLSKSMEASGDVNQQYTKITFTPTQADRLVLAFRNWLRRYGNSQPDWFGSPSQHSLPSAVLSKREMLDRYEQHTLKCSSCKGAYDAFQTSQKVFIGVTVVLCASAGIPSDIQLRLIVAGAALVSAALAYAFHELQKNFVFVDYVHSEID